MMSIDLRLIRFAAALAEHGSFTRAAEALGIAQPTLSRGISDLETTVGIRLFTRGRHGAEPTDFGYVFLRQAAAVSTQFSDLEREIALVKGVHKGEFAAGFGPYAAELLVPDALPRFVSAHPAVRVRLQVESLEVLARALRQRSIDVVVGESTIVEGDESIEVIERLSPLRLYFFVRAGHPLAGAKPSLREALGYPLVQVSRLPPRGLKPLLDALGPAASASTPMPAIECPTVPLAVATVLASDAVMPASLGMVQREIAQGQLVPIIGEAWMHTSWAIAHLRYRTLSPAATAFIAGLRLAMKAQLAQDAALHKRWHAILPGATTAEAAKGAATNGATAQGLAPRATAKARRAKATTLRA